jgi:hypothetical protein
MDKYSRPENLLPLRQQTDDLADDAVSRLQATSMEGRQRNTGQCFGRSEMYSVMKEHEGLWEKVDTVYKVAQARSYY